MEEVFTWLSIVKKLNKHKINFKKSGEFELGSTHTCPYGNIRTDSTHAEEPYLGILASGRDRLLQAREMGWKEPHEVST